MSIASRPAVEAWPAAVPVIETSDLRERRLIKLAGLLPQPTSSANHCPLALTVRTWVS